MSAIQGRKITLVGASGGLGSQIVHALQLYGIHTITAITRTESAAVFPSDVIVCRGAYSHNRFLVDTLKDQDVVILVLSFMALDSQALIINAAAQAGVPWVIPCEFAADNLHEKLNQEISMMSQKNKYREYIDQLGVSSWIGIINGPWFDWSFKKSYWGIDVKARKVNIFNGDTKINTTTLRKVGRSLAALLSLPESELQTFKNQFVYFSSFLVSQRDILNSVIRATGTEESDWVIETKDATKAAEDAKKAIKRGDGMATVDLLFATLNREGFGGNYEQKVFLNKELELEQENFDIVVRKLVWESESRI